MLRRHRPRSPKIRDGPRDLQYPVMRASAQSHAPHSHFEGPLARRVQSAQLSQLANRNMRVVEPALMLHRASGNYAVADLGGGDAFAGSTQLLIRHGGHLDVQIDAIEQRPADLAEVLLDLRTGAAAFARRIAVIPAAAPVHVATATEPEPRVPGITPATQRIEKLSWPYSRDVPSATTAVVPTSAVSATTEPDVPLQRRRHRRVRQWGSVASLTTGSPTFPLSRLAYYHGSRTHLSVVS